MNLGCFVVVFLLLLLDCQCSMKQFQRSHRLNGWEQKHRSDKSLTHTVRIALKQRNTDVLESILASVSDPKSDCYGNYLSVDQLTHLISPLESEQQIVLDWLSKFPLTNLEFTVNKDYILVSAPVHILETMFNTQFFDFSHPNSKSGIVTIQRAHSYAVPIHLSSIIESVHGLITFPPPASRLTVQGDFPGIDISPSIIRTRYNILNEMGDDTSPAQALAEFEQAYFYPDDLTVFQQTFNLPLKNLSRVIGPNHPDQGYLGEATLDIEYIVATAPKVDTWVFEMPSAGFDLIGWASLILSTPDAPKVHSVSWGSEESGFEPSEISRTNVEFQKLAAAGFSVLTASGDDGTGSTGWLFCGSFDPTWPATSPYVTAVGATYIDGTSNKEIAVSFSGGGFSAVNPQPKYQSEKVSNYLAAAQSSLPSSSYYNTTGRAIPDVAAVGTNFQVIIQKYQGSMSGTSAATPVFSGVISLLNDVQSKKGLPLLGFLNPWLYSLDNVGFDIVDGNNKVSNCPSGFPAWKGYDCVTGLGTPDLVSLTKSLPQK